MLNNQPVIGVATTTGCRKQADGHIRPASFYCQIAERAAEYGTQVCLFDPAQAHWKAEKMEAYFPVSKRAPYGHWNKKEVSLPSVIYENIFVHLNIRGYSDELRRQATLRGIPLFNPVLPGKWRMAEWMRSSGLDKYMPETEKLKSTEQLLDRLRHWDTVYIKPTGGYGGVGVTRVRKLGHNRFAVAWDRSQGSIAQVRKEMDERKLRDWVTTRLRRPHLLQEGINLLTIEQRKVDFRVVLQRNLQGEWKLVGIVPKWAAKDGVVTNVIAGGERVSLLQIQNAAHAEGKEISIQPMQQAAFEIARMMERKKPFIGLVGFDMGIDEKGNPLMIEMNPKPARSLLDSGMRRKAAFLAAEFAIYLNNQK
ncbi:hypothetical protein FY534_04780 [Alicyclobacillus sp. TC]|uniref:YheC/YheD family protein n=1 Tax=Alicyclobacillus sp. TC TaxID=2606450 RepID=UPI0019332845|nr:YheC/YheD family protein [Alicyclobacillus sp. TC]QRF23070.1 hypothetical protein FY534_04780 [Alicyclobacillus sp. TC]